MVLSDTFSVHSKVSYAPATNQYTIRIYGAERGVQLPSKWIMAPADARNNVEQATAVLMEARQFILSDAQANGRVGTNYIVKIQAENGLVVQPGFSAEAQRTGAKAYGVSYKVEYSRGKQVYTGLVFLVHGGERVAADVLIDPTQRSMYAQAALVTTYEAQAMAKLDAKAKGRPEPQLVAMQYFNGLRDCVHGDVHLESGDTGPRLVVNSSKSRWRDFHHLIMEEEKSPITMELATEDALKKIAADVKTTTHVIVQTSKEAKHTTLVATQLTAFLCTLNKELTELEENSRPEGVERFDTPFKFSTNYHLTIGLIGDGRYGAAKAVESAVSDLMDALIDTMCPVLKDWKTSIEPGDADWLTAWIHIEGVMTGDVVTLPPGKKPYSHFGPEHIHCRYYENARRREYELGQWHIGADYSVGFLIYEYLKTHMRGLRALNKQAFNFQPIAYPPIESFLPVRVHTTRDMDIRVRSFLFMYTHPMNGEQMQYLATAMVEEVFNPATLTINETAAADIRRGDSHCQCEDPGCCIL